MNIFGNIFGNSLTLATFLIAELVAALLGLVVALSASYKNTFSKSFLTTLVLLPIIEAAVIILVNDNIGMGLSVAGSFSLIRFRSVKGTARELIAIFLAMATGVVCGSGYLMLGVIFTILACIIMLLLTLFNFGSQEDNLRTVKITVPESLNFDSIFEEILNKYSNKVELQEIKTINYGSLFRVEYLINIKKPGEIKNMLDELRTRNGNLEVACCKASTSREEL